MFACVALIATASAVQIAEQGPAVIYVARGTKEALADPRILGIQENVDLAFGGDLLINATALYNMTAWDTTSGVTYTVTGLPAGVTATDGVISGSPSEAGIFKVDVTCTQDYNQESISLPTFKIHVFDNEIGVVRGADSYPATELLSVEEADAKPKKGGKKAGKAAGKAKKDKTVNMKRGAGKKAGKAKKEHTNTVAEDEMADFRKFLKARDAAAGSGNSGSTADEGLSTAEKAEVKDPCADRDRDPHTSCLANTRDECMTLLVGGSRQACMWQENTSFDLNGANYDCADGAVVTDAAGAAGVYLMYSNTCCVMSTHHCG